MHCSFATPLSLRCTPSLTSKSSPITLQLSHSSRSAPLQARCLSAHYTNCWAGPVHACLPTTRQVPFLHFVQLWNCPFGALLPTQSLSVSHICGFLFYCLASRSSKSKKSSVTPKTVFLFHTGDIEQPALLFMFEGVKFVPVPPHGLH